MLLANWILPKVGTRPVDAVRTADFTEIRTAMMEAGRTGKTTNTALVVLSSLVRYWHEQHDRTPPAFRVGLVKFECERGLRAGVGHEAEREREEAGDRCDVRRLDDGVTERAACDRRMLKYVVAGSVESRCVSTEAARTSSNVAFEVGEGAQGQ
jgi:hypothetical protein